MIYGVTMFHRKQNVCNKAWFRVSVAIAAVLVCTSCVPDPAPSRSLSHAPSSDGPIFSSPQEALRAAAETYGRYFEVSDEIAANGGVEIYRIEPFVTPDFLDTTKEGFESLSENDLHISGQTKVTNVALQNYVDEQGSAAVTLNVCVDVGLVKVLDRNGEDSTPPSRKNRVSLVADFVSAELGSKTLVIARNEPWSDDSFC